MTAAAILVLLALIDCVMSGLRAALGRIGRLDKRRYFRAAALRGLLAGVLVVAAHAGLAAALGASWGTLSEAARLADWIYGAFAALITVAFALFYAPIGDFRVLASVVIFGPLTLARPLVLVAGLALPAIRSADPRVMVLATSAGISMLLVERILGRAPAREWRRLIG